MVSTTVFKILIKKLALKMSQSNTECKHNFVCKKTPQSTFKVVKNASVFIVYFYYFFNTPLSELYGHGRVIMAWQHKQRAPTIRFKYESHKASNTKTAQPAMCKITKIVPTLVENSLLSQDAAIHTKRVIEKICLPRNSTPKFS